MSGKTGMGTFSIPVFLTVPMSPFAAPSHLASSTALQLWSVVQECRENHNTHFGDWSLPSCDSSGGPACGDRDSSLKRVQIG